MNLDIFIENKIKEAGLKLPGISEDSKLGKILYADVFGGKAKGYRNSIIQRRNANNPNMVNSQDFLSNFLNAKISKNKNMNEISDIVNKTKKQKRMEDYVQAGISRKTEEARIAKGDSGMREINKTQGLDPNRWLTNTINANKQKFDLEESRRQGILAKAKQVKSLARTNAIDDTTSSLTNMFKSERSKPYLGIKEQHNSNIDKALEKQYESVIKSYPNQQIPSDIYRQVIENDVVKPVQNKHGWFKN